MVGYVIHIWRPNHPNKVCRTPLNRDVYLIEIGENYVPVTASGLRQYNQAMDSVQKEMETSRRNSLQREMAELRQQQVDRGLTPILGSSLESPTSLMAEGSRNNVSGKCGIQAVSSSSSEDESCLMNLEKERQEEYLKNLWQQVIEQEKKEKEREKDKSREREKQQKERERTKETENVDRTDISSPNDVELEEEELLSTPSSDDKSSPQQEDSKYSEISVEEKDSINEVLEQEEEEEEEESLEKLTTSSSQNSNISTNCTAKDLVEQLVDVICDTVVGEQIVENVLTETVKVTDDEREEEEEDVKEHLNKVLNNDENIVVEENVDNEPNNDVTAEELQVVESEIFECTDV